MKNIIGKLAISLLIGGLVLVPVAPAGAWITTNDFITGGGWYIIQSGHTAFDLGVTFFAGCGIPGSRANFGWHGGVKNQQFWGNGNYLDHGCGLHVHNTQVVDYVCISTNGITWEATGTCPSSTSHQDTGTREVCGYASTNKGTSVAYRVRMNDTEPEAAKQDKFGIIVHNPTTFEVLYATEGIPISGGNIELHRGNASNTAPSGGSSGFCDTLRAASQARGIDFHFR
jgi:hypothetical protein